MAKIKQIKNSGAFRSFESSLIILLVVAAIVILASSPRFISAGDTVQETEGQVTSQVVAQANAMPQQGWAPLTVYFSAYGSVSEDGGGITGYEWDLDANGLYDTKVTNTGGYTSYTYAKPGEYLVTLRVTDEHGHTATDTLTINVRHPASSSVDYWTIFDDSQVQKVVIEITQENWNTMWVDPISKVTVKANAIIFGERLEEVGFRMRGQFSLRESGEKKPWKIDTDYYLEGQEFHNLRQLMFINSIGDPTMIQEKLTYDMLAFAGVPASHVSFVEFWIDFVDDSQAPVYWGVYNMIERVDRKFLASRFGQDYKHGNLYKASHAQRGPMDLIYYGDNIEDYPTQGGQVAYGKMTNVEENDYSDVIALAKIVDGTTYASTEEFATALESVFNVDGFLRYMAVMVSIASWDYYPYTGNNFYLYNNPASGKFEWIPWDQTWGGSLQQPLYELELTDIVERAPIYDQVFKVERYRKKYTAYLDLLARHWFNQENIYQQAHFFHNQIAPYVIQSTGDKMYFGTTARFNYGEFDTGWAYLADFADLRSQFILSNLSITPTPPSLED